MYVAPPSLRNRTLLGASATSFFDRGSRHLLAARSVASCNRTGLSLCGPTGHRADERVGCESDALGERAPGRRRRLLCPAKAATRRLIRRSPDRARAPRHATIPLHPSERRAQCGYEPRISAVRANQAHPFSPRGPSSGAFWIDGAPSRGSRRPPRVAPTRPTPGRRRGSVSEPGEGGSRQPLSPSRGRSSGGCRPPCT